MDRIARLTEVTCMLPALAIITALLNVVFTLLRRDSRIFMFASLSLTLLTVCEAYCSDISIIQTHGYDADLLAIELYRLPVIASILINSVGLIGIFRK